MFCRDFPTLDGRALSMPAWNEVHVWSARLDLTPEARGRLEDTLEADERKRAHSFIRESDRCRSIVSRGILRMLLASYFGLEPEEIVFAYGSYGKPQLSPSLAESGLRFNLSHGDGWALYAIAYCREVGIDIESQQRDMAWWQLAPLVFSAKERAELETLPTGQKMAAFLRGWTRKEAYVKGQGDGLFHSLDSFDVPLARIKSPWPINANWWLHPIDHIAGYVGALAVEGAPVRPLYRCLTPLPWQADSSATINDKSPVRWERWPPAVGARESRV